MSLCTRSVTRIRKKPLATFQPGHKKAVLWIYSAGPRMRHVGLQPVRGSIQTKSPRRQYIFPRFLKNFGFSCEKPRLHTLLCTGGFSDQFWWSQAGSNRRPPACKAGALPAELWPRTRLTCQRAKIQRRNAQKWWVWEELNFRPHPYQGCALTN